MQIGESAALRKMERRMADSVPRELREWVGGSVTARGSHGMYGNMFATFGENLSDALRTEFFAWPRTRQMQSNGHIA